LVVQSEKKLTWVNGSDINQIGEILPPRVVNVCRDT